MTATRFLNTLLVALLFPFASLSAEPRAAAIEFVLDLSGSMTRSLSGRPQYQGALEVLERALTDPSYLSALRVYARRYDQESPERSCTDTELILPFGYHSIDEVRPILSGMKPRGYTPLAYSLAQVANDFAKVSSSLHRSVVILSDGNDSCGGDPVAEAELLRKRGLSVTFHTMGINPDQETSEQLRRIAAVSGGEYSEIRSIQSLDFAMKDMIGMETDTQWRKAHPLPQPTKTPLPQRRGDNATSQDAGDIRTTALLIKNGVHSGNFIGGEDSQGRDAIDAFRFSCDEGEKFRISIAGAAPFEADLVVRDGDDGELVRSSGALSQLGTDVFQATKSGECLIVIALKNPAVATASAPYSLELKAMVGLSAQN